MLLNKILSGLLLAAVCSSTSMAAEPVMDFTGNFNFEAAMRDVDPVPAASPARISVFNSLRATRNCKFVSFSAGDALVAAPVTLVSHVFEKICREYQDGRHCSENLLRIEKRKVTVELTGNRAPLTWERDVFGICLEDTSISVEVIEASHKYKVIRKPGMPEYRVEALAEGKMAADPDPSGLTMSAWAFSGKTGGFELKLKDKWAAVYGGCAGQEENTVIKLTLLQANPGWFDGVVLEKTLSVPPAELYKIDFSQYASEFRRPLETGRQYYVRWGFSRAGAISRNTFVPGGESSRVLFLP
ncbi:MAG: hypothetical protein A2234_05665 [Elusimicrobia bacterium RIFOXYA2_FULL_58_8]|nr:MAG: hypothetical protein A2285_03000 [Elusimicrobia bacterium RIFOXYA12_FULL_57_11]OGS13795.1 MAG: hypothetical protein A2234_05665 [Elusimicrobia bacterium RIFOXYA2_FULL_58_8]